MLSHTDLPGCTSTTHNDVSAPRIIPRSSRLFHVLSQRVVVKTLLGISVPAALLSTAIPTARPAAQAHVAPAAVFALAGTASAFIGDSGLSEAELAQLDELGTIEGTLDFGAPVAKDATARIATSMANFREGPGLSHDKITELKRGVVVTLLERTTGWFRVRTAAGSIGWVSEKVLTLAAGAAEGIAVAKDVPAKPVSGQVTTTNRAVNLRKGPGTQYASLGKLPKGVKLDLVAQQAAWYKVTTPAGTTGWVTSSFVAPSQGTAASASAAAPAAPAAASSAAAVGTVSRARTNLRQGPATAFASLGKLTANARLTLLARSGDWFKVQTKAGSIGWVSGDLLNISAAALRNVPVTNNVAAVPAKATTQATASIPGSSRGATAARVALRYVGSRYIWGGASPRGFDCSGLVLYAYRQAGLSLPHKASLQFSTRYGARINSVGALKTGDIVFFANTAGRGITHVALYVGNGRMVTANSPRSGVRLQNINTRYWRSHFAGAIRPG